MDEIRDEFREELNIQADYSRKLAVASANKEDQMLAEILQQHLGRIVITDDFKDCQVKFYEGRPNEYTFVYKGEELGVVKRKLEMCPLSNEDFINNKFTISYTITFHPLKGK